MKNHNKFPQISTNFNKYLLISLIILLGFFGLAGGAEAAPAINSVSGTVAQGTTVNITGSGFGTKSPAAPLLWDDGESGILFDKWSEAWPDESSSVFNTAYRTSPFRTVTPPHNHNNTKFISGGHDPAGYSPFNQAAGPNVIIGKNISNPSKLYISYYHRFDPNWPTQNNNFHVSNFSSDNTFWGTGGFDGTYCGSDPFGYSQIGSGCDMGYGCQQCDENPAAYNFSLSYLKTWHKEEQLIKNTSGGFWDIYHDNVIRWDTSTCDPAPHPINRVGLGGYWRKTAAEDGDSNAFMYWDDIYIDTAFSRIILANNPDYSQATIIEPQIPSAWSDGSITAKVNLGKLPDSGTAYFFVFDADNNHNAVGYPVILGATVDTTPPAAPSGLSVQ